MNQEIMQDAELPTPKAPVWLSLFSLAGGLVQGVCAVLVASSSLKVLLSVAAIAGAVRTSWLHANGVRLPLMAVSALLALITLYVLWNGQRLRNRSGAQWRKRSLSLKDKLAIAFCLISSVATLVLVAGEALEHPIFR